MPQLDTFLDYVAITLDNLGPMQASDVSATLQRHIMLDRMKTRVMPAKGKAITIRWIRSTGGSFVMTEPYDADSLTNTDIIAEGTVPWKFGKFGWHYDDRLVSLQGSAEMLLDDTIVKRNAEWVGFAEGMEPQGWDAPASAADNTHMYGVKYWLKYSATEGFNGSGTNIAGLDTTAAANVNLRNYTGNYAAVSQDDLIAKMRRGAILTNFESPIDTYTYNTGPAEANRIYTGIETFDALATAARQQNSQIGPDIAYYIDKTLFQGRLIQHVPYLDSARDSGRPLFMINWNSWRWMVDPDMFLKQSAPIRGNGAIPHNVVQVWVDFTSQMTCHDFRANSYFRMAA